MKITVHVVSRKLMNTGRLFMNIDLETLSQGKYQGRPLTDTDEYIPCLRIGLKKVRVGCCYY